MEKIPGKRGPGRKRDKTDSGKPWGEPIEWPHERPLPGKKVPVTVPLNPGKKQEEKIKAPFTPN